MFLTFFLLLLNTVISFWNAHVAGRYWTERKQLPTWTQIMMWCAAVMAVCGFFYVIVAVLTMIMYDLNIFEWLAMFLFKMELAHAEAGEIVEYIFSFAYLMVIFPVLGTGIMITINSWIIAYARRDWASMGVAAYNTGAQFYNTVRALQYVPQATKSLGSGLKLKLGKDSGKVVVYLVLFGLPIVISLGLAVAITVVIMKASDERYQLDDMLKATA